MNSSVAAPLEERFAAIHARIDAALKEAGRAPDATTLIAVTKGHGEDAIEAAIALGQRDFGENRVQEAQKKWPMLKARHPEIRLHLIGGLQTNKCAAALALFDVIHTLDRPKLADALVTEAATGLLLPPLFVQINTGEEPQKGGIMPTDADAFIAASLARKLPVTGLMCIPPAEEEPALHFALLAKFARRHGLAALSMGMSDDFETAIRFGATQVRVGSALFGNRA